MCINNQLTNNSFSGKLFVIATPIGNLEDITLRALKVLKEVDYILCEDTRKTLKLLNHYNIKKKLVSFFVRNEHKRIGRVVEDLLNGKNIGLVSNAGTPCISDPGNNLVKICHKEGINVVPVPGVSALTTALSVSGLTNYHTLFIGFLPRSNKKINKIFTNIKEFKDDINVIIYESPYRVEKLLERILKEFGDIKIFIFKELTKVFENIIISNVKKILADIRLERIKFQGEYVIIFNKGISDG